MSTPEQPQRTLRALLDSEIQAVLATQHQQQPYTSLMAFAVTPDLRQIVFATNRATEKYSNLLDNLRASLLIDNRCNDSADYRNAVAISAQGATRVFILALFTQFSFPQLRIRGMPRDVAQTTV